MSGNVESNQKVNNKLNKMSNNIKEILDLLKGNQKMMNEINSNNTSQKMNDNVKNNNVKNNNVNNTSQKMNLKNNNSNENNTNSNTKKLIKEMKVAKTNQNKKDLANKIGEPLNNNSKKGNDIMWYSSKNGQFKTGKLGDANNSGKYKITSAKTINGRNVLGQQSPVSKTTLRKLNSNIEKI
jgi:hypothetical protein